MMSETTRKAPLFEPSTDRLVLGNYLKRRFIEEKVDFVSYTELNAAIGGRDVQNGARFLLNGAREDFTRDHHLGTVVVRSEGIRLSNDPAGCLDRPIQHIERTARKATRTAGRLLANEQLSNDDRRGLLSRTAQLGVLMQFSGSKALKQIEGKIDEKSPSHLPLLPTIDAVREQFAKKH